MEVALRLRAAAESAIGAIGLGYDVTQDLRLKYCKGKSPAARLIEIDDENVREVVVPGDVLIKNVSNSIDYSKGERMRFSSDILDFQQMAEHFNHDMSLSGRIPSGQFNAAFEYTGCWQKDAANTKSLALDGVFITLYNITLKNSQITLFDHVKNAVPSSWEPAEFAKFIDKFGTHVVVGVEMGGKDVLYMKQHRSSPLPIEELQTKLKDVAENRFGGQQNDNPTKTHEPELLERNNYGLINLDPGFEDISIFWRRRGGSYRNDLDHNAWCLTVHLEPELISMSLMPIISLLSGTPGVGFLSHAINLYLRYKPPIEDLQQFLEFQIPRQWAPKFGDLPIRQQKHRASLQFRLLGPKLYVNTNQVDVDNNPVTGLRLYLEGRRMDHLAIHLQHLSSKPQSFFKLIVEPNTNSRPDDPRYYEQVQWKYFSHIYTAPVESDDEQAIVTGAHLEVNQSGLKQVLCLRLRFAKVVGATVVRQPEWDDSPLLTKKSETISTLFSGLFSSSQKAPPRQTAVDINSAVYPEGPPVRAHGDKLLRFVDTTEFTRGPLDLPGYWVVSGARLVVEKSKISLRVKFSLLAVISTQEDNLQ